MISRAAALIGVALASAGALAWRPAVPPRVVWNASASAPLGLYWLTRKAPKIGDFVLAAPPADARRLAAARGYLPASIDLVKRVAAGPGSAICAAGRRILIDGKAVAERLERDSLGRPLPVWNGCRILGVDEVFLLMEGVPDSFDGRYFGPVRTSAIVGVLSPLWTFWPGHGAPGEDGPVSKIKGRPDDPGEVVVCTSVARPERLRTFRVASEKPLASHGFTIREARFLGAAGGRLGRS
jgi:conjugative transfer signal peptidase TraF